MTTGAKDFTRGAIFGPLVKLALPIMTTNFVQMLYYLTDMAWIGRLGSEQVAAVGAVGMLMWMFSSFALFTKVAAEVSIGQALGARKNRVAKAFASHTTTLSLIISIVVAVFLFSSADWVLSFFKLSPYTQAYAVEYLRIVSWSVPFSFLVMNFVGVYNGAGRSNIPMLLVCSGLVLNIIFDPLLIYGIDGIFKGMGIRGAAIATVIAQGVVFSLLVYRLRRHDGILNRFPFFVRLRSGVTVRILRLGFPIAMMTLFFAIINSYLVRIASIYGGHLGVVAKTAGGQIEGITWITAQGFSTALGAFVAQNFAAGKMSRAWMAYRYTLGLMLTLGILVTLAFLFAGEQIFGVIVPEPAAATAGGKFLFVAAFYQIFMMLELTTQGMFNGTGRTMPPAVISIIFNLARIPMAYIFASWMGIEGVWWAIAISGIIKGIALPIWLVKLRRERKV
ncbi:MAG: MATE family efflux transporter [Bacteroidales bacterium]|nr:MATE family efflux transporter [Bacteroidales bacterium]